MPMRSTDYDFWMANDAPDFGIFPLAVSGIADEPAPIRLQRGNIAFGAMHIDQRHRNWVLLHANSVAELVWKKCRQPGHIYAGDDLEQGKIWLPIHPNGLMILKFVTGQNFWTVVTLYFREGELDGNVIGGYQDTLLNPPTTPTFAIRPISAPIISYKRRRTSNP